MNIRETSNGKFQYTMWYVDARTGKNRRVSVTLEKNTAHAKREAERILNEKIRRLNAEVDFSDITLEEGINRYYEYQLRTVKLSTANRNYGKLNVLARLLGPDTRLDKLNAGYINRVFLESGRSNLTLQEDTRRLKAFLNWAYRNDLVKDISYLTKLERYKVEKTPEQYKYLEKDELVKLLQNMKVPINRLLVEFLALSGLRIGEALALQWTDINLSKKQLNIDKTYDSINKVITSTKTEHSNRVIHIQPELAKNIKEIKKYYSDIGVFSVFVFVGYSGDHLNLASIEKYFRENCEAILGKRLHPHSLRHTHASLLFERGMSLDAVSLRLGHADSKVTKAIYLHITEKKREEYDSQLEKISLLS